MRLLLTPHEAAVLLAIDHGSHVPELAAAAHLTPSIAADAVFRLEKKGLVRSVDTGFVDGAWELTADGVVARMFLEKGPSAEVRVEPELPGFQHWATLDDEGLTQALDDAIEAAKG
jgi:hypothetical protein